MKTLQNALGDYLAMRRALGFKLRQAGKALLHFVLFLENRGAEYITTPLALEWALEPASAKPATWAQRLSYVRGFAQYVSASDTRTEIPSCQLLPHKVARARPYIYTELEVEQLMQAAQEMPGKHAIQKRTYYCLLGLLAVSGMRISEALNLKAAHVDLSAGVLTIEGTKFGKSRLLPLHTSTQKILADYLQCRNQFLRDFDADYFFVNMVGNRLDSGTFRRTFYELSRKIGLRGKDAASGPRLHDFRHRFAVETLLRWYRHDEDVERRLPTLSTYLGHVHVSDTYWYLTSYPELMGESVKRLELRWEVKA